MALDVVPSGQACGATVRGVDLRDELSDAAVAEIRGVWLEHRVLSFPDQPLSDGELERFTLQFGPFGSDPFFESIDGHSNIAAVHRNADETTSIFADSWHTDWSFQPHPPDGTCLLSKIIPPAGGDTLFADQVAALAAMPAELLAKVDGRRAVHSARGGYSPDGLYGDFDGPDRAMKIKPSEAAYATETHPVIRTHPETATKALYGTFGYVIDIDEMVEAADLLAELWTWQTRDEFVYQHSWEADMLVMWDNRSVLHRATGGFDGHERLLHRTTIGQRSTARPF